MTKLEREIQRAFVVEIPVRVHGWVCWVAQDEDGGWWGYASEPIAGKREWLATAGDPRSCWVARGLPNPEWQDELYELEN